MLDPGGASAPGSCYSRAGTLVPCPEPAEFPIVVDGNRLLMIVLLIALLVWWVENWKRDKFKEWWEDE